MVLKRPLDGCDAAVRDVERQRVHSGSKASAAVSLCITSHGLFAAIEHCCVQAGQALRLRGLVPEHVHEREQRLVRIVLCVWPVAWPQVAPDHQVADRVGKRWQVLLRGEFAVEHKAPQHACQRKLFAPRDAARCSSEAEVVAQRTHVKKGLEGSVEEAQVAFVVEAAEAVCFFVVAPVECVRARRGASVCSRSVLRLLRCGVAAVLELAVLSAVAPNHKVQQPNVEINLEPAVQLLLVCKGGHGRDAVLHVGD